MRCVARDVRGKCDFLIEELCHVHDGTQFVEHLHLPRVRFSSRLKLDVSMRHAGDVDQRQRTASMKGSQDLCAHMVSCFVTETCENGMGARWCDKHASS